MRLFTSHFYNILSQINIILIMFAVFTSQSRALSNDPYEKAYISANSSHYNYKTGINLFDGHAIIDQGATHLTADRITTKNNSHHQIQEAIAYGLQELAHYWTVPKTGDQVMHAYAKIIKFYPQEANVVLQGDAKLIQGANSFHGPLILYNIKEQTVTVPPSKGGRAVLIYHPNQNQ